MKKNLLFTFSAIALLCLTQMAMSQVTMPAAISIDPSNGTAWDEITLTLDPSKGCTPDGKGSVAGASIIKMHSAAVLFDQKDGFESKSIWGAVGIDYDATPKDGVHDGPDLTPNGDGTYSITFTPADFYGVEEGSTVIGITAVFNAGTWDNECHDVGDDGCIDFFIPLTYTDPTPALKFKLDLTYQEELGNFNKDNGKAYVIVDGTEYEMDQLLEGLFPVAKYEYVLKDGIVEDQEYTYKFKMDDTEESIDARTVTATGSQITLSHFFNDEEAPVETGELVLNVDMRYLMREGTFDASQQYVDVAGTINGWDGSNSHLTDDDADSVYSITVPDLDLYSIQQYKFRLDGSWDADSSEFPNGGPNRYAMVREGSRTISSVYNNYRPGWVPVTLAVNMARAIDAGLFDPEKDYVDVAGTINNWSGENDLVDGDADMIYVTSPAAIYEAGDTMQFKFRINSSWDAGYSDAGDNRKMAVMDTTGGVVNAGDTVWFNYIPLFIGQDKISRIGKVRIYPNPVEDVLYIDNAVDMSEIRIINMMGQVIRRIPAGSRTFYELNTADLQNGIYILSVYGKDGFKGVARFIKK